LTDVYHWGRTLIGAGGYQATDFPRMLAAVTGSTPVIDSVRPFAELPEALAAMERGDFFGKLVVEMREGDGGQEPVNGRSRRD
jgi:hypothetical protein